MAKIFISYRRTDSQFVTDNIYDFMSREFGDENVFLDVGSIPFGVDFRDYLREQIVAHDVVLVIIGPEWAKIMQERVDQPNDFVRIEIENALVLNKLVIPVLVMSAEMPNFSALPTSIQDLQWRNSAVVRRMPDFRIDCSRIVDGIREYMSNHSASKPAHRTTEPKKVFALTPIEKIIPPPFDWIKIPVGQNMVDNKSKSVEEFSIAKYPITNYQFVQFLNADGYSSRQWWTDAGWEVKEKQNWTAPRYAGDSKFDDLEQPVVGVSWYEAVAFCNWLSTMTGDSVTLPTEHQWQRAAQGDDNHLYPWGNEWDDMRCNHSVDRKGIGQTTMVRHFEKVGASPFGVVDMAGNVWEWCRNFANNDCLRRGGAWNDTKVHHFAVLRRSQCAPILRENNLGFRVVKQ